LILARMEFERIVEDRASIEGQALQQFAEAAYPLIDVVGAGLDQTGTGTSWKQLSRRSTGDRRRPCHSSTGTSTPTPGCDGSTRG
jgi:hypothetical protein